MNKKVIRSAIALLVILTIGLIISIVVLTKDHSKTEIITIGFSGPLTGEASSWGLNAAAGIELAVNEINAQGGIDGKQIKLILEDDTCTSNSVNTVTKLITVDSIDGLLGPICSSSAAPALPIAVQYNIPTILPTASAPDLTKLGENIFRVCPSDTVQGSFAANFLYTKIQSRKAAVLYVQNAWGEGLHTVFSKEFILLGGDVVYSASVSQEEKDFKTELLKLKQSGADVIYAPVYPSNAIALFKQMKETNFEIPVIGGDVLEDDAFKNSPYSEGAMFIVANTLFSEEFKTKVSHVEGYENMELNFVSALGYDAAKVLFAAMEKQELERQKLDKSVVIADLKNTFAEGVSSKTITFDENGDLKNPAAKVKIIKNHISVVYDD